jgi:hypothetical protein
MSSQNVRPDEIKMLQGTKARWTIKINSDRIYHKCTGNKNSNTTNTSCTHSGFFNCVWRCSVVYTNSEDKFKIHLRFKSLGTRCWVTR